MVMTYDGALVMPSSFAVMEQEEMTYVDGGYYDSGYSLGYIPKYATKSGAFRTAGEIKGAFNWNNISQFELAAEIWFHTYTYYNDSALNSLCASMGYTGLTSTRFWKSLKNGIQIKNGKDDAEIFGVKRYVIFQAAYLSAPSL